MSEIDGRESVRCHQPLVVQDREDRILCKQSVFDELPDSTTNNPRSPLNALKFLRDWLYHSLTFMSNSWPASLFLYINFIVSVVLDLKFVSMFQRALV